MSSSRSPAGTKGYIEVEKIARHRINRQTGRMDLLCHFVGFGPSQDRWLPFSHIRSGQLIRQYLRRHNLDSIEFSRQIAEAKRKHAKALADRSQLDRFRKMSRSSTSVVTCGNNESIKSEPAGMSGKATNLSSDCQESIVAEEKCTASTLSMVSLTKETPGMDTEAMIADVECQVKVAKAKSVKITAIGAESNKNKKDGICSKGNSSVGTFSSKHVSTHRDQPRRRSLRLADNQADSPSDALVSDGQTRESPRKCLRLADNQRGSPSTTLVSNGRSSVSRCLYITADATIVDSSRGSVCDCSSPVGSPCSHLSSSNSSTLSGSSSFSPSWLCEHTTAQPKVEVTYSDNDEIIDIMGCDSEDSRSLTSVESQSCEMIDQSQLTTHLSLHDSSDSGIGGKRPCSPFKHGRLVQLPSKKQSTRGTLSNGTKCRTLSPRCFSKSTISTDRPRLVMAPTVLHEFRDILNTSRPALYVPELSANTHYQMALCGFEHHINQVSRGKDSYIYIENVVDEDLSLFKITYTCERRYSSRVECPHPRSSHLHCSCSKGQCLSSGCLCRSLSLSNGYNKQGRIRKVRHTAIVECTSLCGCDTSCKNRVVQNGRLTPLCIFRTEEKGWGVKSTEPIPRGTFVSTYTGEVITDDEAEVLGKDQTSKGITYLFDMDYNALSGQDTYTIDASSYGNVSRFFNHSCSPNMTVCNVWYDTLDLRFPHLAFFTSKNVEAGEELTFDYCISSSSSPVAPSGDSSTSDPCKCGSHKCKGALW